MRYIKWKLFAWLILPPLSLYWAIAQQISWYPRHFTVGGPIQSMKFAPDGKTIAIGRYRYVTLSKTATQESWLNAGQLELWNVNNRQPYQLMAHKEESPIDHLYFTKVGNHIIYANQDGDTKIIGVLTQRSKKYLSPR